MIAFLYRDMVIGGAELLLIRLAAYFKEQDEIVQICYQSASQDILNLLKKKKLKRSIANNGKEIFMA